MVVEVFGARADDALRAMSGSFQQWREDEVGKLQTRRLGASAARRYDDSLEALMLAAHDLKGLGGTYDYPLVTQLAASLCRLIDSDEGKAAVRAGPALLTGHIDAIRAAVRDGIKTDKHPIGSTVLRTLEARVDALGLPRR